MAVKLLLLCALFRLASATAVKSCESGITTPSVILYGCPDGPPCTLKYDTVYNLKITFQTDSNATNPRNEVTIQKFDYGFHVKYAEDLDVCDNLYLANGGKAHCPLKPGKTYKYAAELKLTRLWWLHVSLTATMRWAIVSEGDHTTVACFEIQDVTIEN